MKAARFIGIAVFILTCLGGSVGARAEPLEQLISETVENHDRVQASRAQVESARQRSLVALGVWYPNLNLTAGVERYRLERTGQATQTEPGQDLTATITQLLWDFGASNASIERSRLEFTQSEIGLVQVRQDLTAEAISAYINLLRSAEIVGFAQRSEENIRKQTGLEEARIEAGSGLSTDLLQAKTQLAGAQARRVDAEGNYELALNRYRAVFGDVPGDLAVMPGIDIDRSFVPESLDAALQQAFSGNPQIRLTSLDISIAQQDRIAAKAENFTPTFEMIGERSMLKNDGGTIGRKNESSIKLQLSFPFNLGFTSINTLRAAQSDEVAATRTMGDLERTIEERVRNAWKQLETARLRSGYLFDQAGIARAFLEVAIQERSLGQRSLIDVLAGETSLINAQSDAVAAEAEVLLAMVELLSAAGALEYDVIKTVPRPDRSEMLAPIATLSDQMAPDPAMDLLLSPTGQGGTLDPSAPLDPSQINSSQETGQDGSVFTPPAPQSSLTAPTEPPTSALTPDAPKVPAEPPAQTQEGLRSMLEAPPSFETDTDPVPDPANAPSLPRPDPPNEPPRASVEPIPQPTDPSPPESSTGGAATDSDPIPDAEAAPKGELDNPLFNWAQ
ncbi:MAG: hypothetical protein CMM78_07680 [Rhodospirillaceae bacterium]|jgi:adhesin transport system outer membrane protein|uniref:TolC family protein n=1 Tax=Hwanghaeella sp. 1Z406 TaxID=3402811 RepID=UPI000C691C0D|nr:hypothetical protein [Rhodospirillales bacterium]MAX48074.1 hypothetical protein [Rhodospirillaceae bacterium]|tara:strand:- start:40871 stop:42730 length:1860 start_codon:yes stop_codon:yes gene_type:complete